MPVSVLPPRRVGAHGTDSDMSTAAAIATPTDANCILVQATGDNVRYTLDGTTPELTVGFVITAAADEKLIPLPEFSIFTVFEEGTGAILQYQFMSM